MRVYGELFVGIGFRLFGLEQAFSELGLVLDLRLLGSFDFLLVFLAVPDTC